MASIRALRSIGYAATVQGPAGADISPLLAPPFDIMDAELKARLIAGDPHNITAVDLPYLPPKVVGPDAVYQEAGRRFEQWLAEGVLRRQPPPVLLAYRQTFDSHGRRLQRVGLFAGVAIQPFGRSPDGRGGVWPHELTFKAGTEDRIRLMRTTRAQLSPVFGLYSDRDGAVRRRLEQVMRAGPPSFHGVTVHDGVRHEVWTIADPAQTAALVGAFEGSDLFIADGHHRYTTALNYRQELIDAQGGQPLPADHPANFALFVLVAQEDPGMVVWPTHRVLGGMDRFSLAGLADAARGVLDIRPFAGQDLAALERALPQAGPHALGLFDCQSPDAPLHIATTVDADPLAAAYPTRTAAWRQLDVAVVQHLLVERLCQPRFCRPGGQVAWRYPHTLEEFSRDCRSDGFQLGVLVQPTPLASVMAVSLAGELMPQKSTFFYPKLATGLVINPVG